MEKAKLIDTGFDVRTDAGGKDASHKNRISVKVVKFGRRDLPAAIVRIHSYRLEPVLKEKIRKKRRLWKKGQNMNDKTSTGFR